MINVDKIDNRDYGVLYIIATPIGNLEDITLRAIRILKEVDLIATEDTRHSLKLLNHFEISKPLISYHRHNEDIKTELLIRELKSGKNIALISDAGTPGISDPGVQVIKNCIKENIKIVPIPGACALINGLVGSGLDTKEFTFLGFLPLNKKNRKEKLEEIKNTNKTLILYEAPHKISSTIKELSEILGDRQLVMARELTKVHEEFVRGTVNELSELVEDIKGEIVLIIDKCEKVDSSTKFNEMSLKEHYALYESQGFSKKDIIKRIAKDRKVNKNEIYKEFI